MATPAAGSNLTAAALDGMVAKWATNFDVTSRTTASATYTETLSPAGLCGISFVAPASGSVKVEWKADISASAAGIHAISYELRTGTTVGAGTSVLVGSDDRAMRNDASGVICDFGVFDIVTGLTSGSTYNVSLSQKTNSGTLTVARRLVLVTQLL